MRTIKFRAWDRVEKKMVTSDGLENQTWNIYKSMLDPLNSNWDFMQYTGLHDKNGKEIYEGDILRTPTFDYDPSEGDAPYELLEVIWDRSGWRAGKYELSDYDRDEIQVIGNIYENPELLNK